MLRLASRARANALSSTLASYVTNSSLSSTLGDYATTSSVTSVASDVSDNESAIDGINSELDDMPDLDIVEDLAVYMDIDTSEDTGEDDTGEAGDEG